MWRWLEYYHLTRIFSRLESLAMIHKHKVLLGCLEHGVFKDWMRGTKYFGCSFVLDLLENFLMIMITGRRVVVVVVEFNVNVLMVFGVTLCQESGSWS